MSYSESTPKSSSAAAQGSSNAQQQRDPPPYNVPPVYIQAQPPVEYAIFVPRPGAGYRFLSSFAVATFIWVLFSMLVQTSVNALRTGHRHQTSDGDYTVPMGVHIDRCTAGNDWKTSSASAFQYNSPPSNFRATGQTSYTLPISSATLFFVSRGRNLGGSIDVVTSADQDADSATVKVVVSSTNSDALGHTRACLLTRGQDGHGVGVFTPISTQVFPGNSNSNFHITVVLPQVGGRAPLSIKDFETDLPNSSHQIGDLSKKVLFEKLSLSGSNRPIAVKSLAATTATISNNNGAITGVFNTTKTLTLSTSNSPITVDVGLTSTGRNTTPSLKAVTSNGALSARISLISASGSQGSFSVNAGTSNQKLQISFPTSPAGSQLVLRASTSNSPATVTLDGLYTGGFNLQTSAFSDATVNNVHQELTERQVHVSNIGRGMTSGEVYWQTGPNANGMVSVSTSNSGVLLKV